MIITTESKHSLCEANWIWPGGHMYVYNQYVAFRKDFTLDNFENAEIYITADQLYKLYINGKYVCRGPARGYQSHWPFDGINITQYLQNGHNWISVLAYNPGISTNQYMHLGAVGFLCSCKIDDKLIVSDESWKMRRLSGFKTMTGRYSVQMAFQEHVDLSAYNSDWILNEEFNEDWADPEINKISHHPIFSFGRAPYDSCETREIPMLRETDIIPGKLLFKTQGSCEENFKNWDNISWGWVKEAKKCEDWAVDFPIRNFKSENYFNFEIGKTGRNKYKSLTFDAGEYLVGTLDIQINGADGSEIIDFQFHENIVNGRPAIRDEGSACQIALANRIFPQKGNCNHEFYHYLGFKYFTVIVRNSTRPLSISLKIRKVEYPFTMNGKFRCSDKLVNDIFDICRRTQQICSLDAYVDTPWREQAQWWGDARVQAKNTFYLDGDSELFKRGIRSIAGQSTDQGLTFGHAPTVGYNCILPDFSITWIITLWDYYWQTGDISLFKEQYDRVKKILKYFDSRKVKCSKTGLIKYDERFWYFGDWADIYRGYIPTLLNLWYALALKTLAYMTDFAGMKKDCIKFRELFTKHKVSLKKYLYDDKLKCYCGGLDEDLNQAKPFSIHDQVMAMSLNLLSNEKMILKDWILPYLKDKKIDAAAPSAFWSAYLLGKAGKSGYAKETLDFIKKKWAPMLETGTTWETFAWSEKEIFSASHAWSAHPAYHFTNILTGIWQIAPAWEIIEFRPSLMDGYEYSESTIPSPKGEIFAAWKKTTDTCSCTLRIPDGVTANVYFKGKTVTHNKKGEYTL
jgi:alpha-L-rhamnosidase